MSKTGSFRQVLGLHFCFPRPRPYDRICKLCSSHSLWPRMTFGGRPGSSFHPCSEDHITPQPSLIQLDLVPELGNSTASFTSQTLSSLAVQCWWQDVCLASRDWCSELIISFVYHSFHADGMPCPAFRMVARILPPPDKLP